MFPFHCQLFNYRHVLISPRRFEWENKVNINTRAPDLRAFLARLQSATNMACLTPAASMKGECQFLSANLYARSVFGKPTSTNPTPSFYFSPYP